MGLSVNIANVVSVEVDGERGLFVMDPSTGKVYGLPLSEVDPSLAGRIVMAAMGQNRADIFDVPGEHISEVMKAKDAVMESNKKALRGGF
jgi:NADPH-dependent glutamate synthase beta subunit-like oxidoreductase